ncbi:hypothetical protein LZ32DRAFT_194622 [Colletotrichum eremochloae]|nr:hypothetical protein LZ32DRAFT_194622 [Colletotrichum eremochloae]
MSSELEKSSDIDKSIKLISRKDWPEWYIALKYHAKSKGVWKYIDPDNENEQKIDEKPTVKPFKDWLREYNAGVTDAEKITMATPNAVAFYKLEVGIDDNTLEIAKRTRAYEAIETWVRNTVDNAFLTPARMELLDEGSKETPNGKTTTCHSGL